MIDGLGGEEVIQVSGVGLTTQSPFFTGSVTAGNTILAPNIIASTALSGTALNTGAIGGTIISGTNLRYNNAIANGSEIVAGTVQGLNVIGTTSLSGANAFVTNVVASTLVSGTGVNTAVISGTNLRFNNAVVNGSVIATGDVKTSASFVHPYTTSTGIVIDNIATETNVSGGMWVVGSAASGTTPAVVLKAAAASQAWPLGIALADTASGGTPSILARGYYRGLIADETLAAGNQIAMGAGGALNTVKLAITGSNSRGTVIMGAGSEGAVLAYLY